MFQTTYDFTLPNGYVDREGNVHRKGSMRLATAADEILPLRDPRVQQNPEYLSIIILSRTIVTLGTVETVSTAMIEQLFSADFKFLQNMYQMINNAEEPVIHVACPHCGKEFTHKVSFEG